MTDVIGAPGAADVRPPRVRLAISFAVLTVAACGGGDSAVPTAAVAGTVSGLQGSGLVLLDNGTDPLPIAADGSFVFAAPVVIGSAYRVTIATQPTNPVQNCLVMNAGSRGSASSAVAASVTVVCKEPGRFVYAGSGIYPGSGTLGVVSGFGIDPSTGALAELPGGSIGFAGDVMLAPAGKFLYVVSAPGGIFAVAPASGALALVSRMPSIGHAFLQAPVFAPSAAFAYGIVRDPPSPGIPPFLVYHPDRIYTFALNADSSAAAFVGNPVAAGVSITSVALDPNGKFAYATSPFPCVAIPSSLSCSGVGPAGLWSFALDPGTGRPAPAAGTPYQSATPLESVAVEPGGRFVYVDGRNSAPGAAGVITVLAVDPASGSSTPIKGSPYVADAADPGPLVIEPSGSFLFVPNYSTNSVSAYAIDAATGALEPVAGSPFATDRRPRTIAVDPSGKFAYIAHGPIDENDPNDLGSITGWTIDGATGALAPLAGNPVAVGVARRYVAIHPGGKFAYVADAPGGISAYRIADTANGEFTAVGGRPVATGAAPVAVAVSPSGRFVYVANSGSDDVLAYSIDATSGAVTPVAAGPVAAGTSPSSIAVDPGERFAYVTNLESNNVSAYSINGQSGALTPISGGPFAAGGFPSSVTIDSRGEFAYVANVNPETISVYAIDRATGGLAPVAASPFDTGLHAQSPKSIAVDASGHVYLATLDGVVGYTFDRSTGAMASMGPKFGPYSATSNVTIDPTGRFVFAINDSPGGVLAFTIDAASGALSSVPGSPFTTAAQAYQVTVDPGGSRAYVVGPAGVWVHSIDSVTGALTPMAGNPTAPGMIRPRSVTIAGSPR